MNRLLPILACWAVLVGAAFAQSNSWLSMDYRAPGLTYTSTNWPTTNTTYDLIWRAIRQVRGEAVGFATASHYRNGEHQSNSILGVHIADGAILPSLYNSNDLYHPGLTVTQILTNVVAVWTNWGTATTDGTAVTGIGTNVLRWQQIIATAPTVVAGGTGYVQDEVVTLEGDGVPGHESAAHYKVNLDDAMIGSVGSVSIWAGDKLGSYETEPTGTLPTAGGTGGGLTLAASGQFETFVYRGPFTGLVVGTVVKLTDTITSAVWTGSVVTLNENYTSFQGSNAVGFTSTNSVLDLFNFNATNSIPHPTWTNNTPIWPDAPLTGDILSVEEKTIIIGPNNLKLWVKVMTWEMSYNSHNYGNPFPSPQGPVNEVSGIVPPMSNVFVLLVKPYAGPKMYIGYDSGGSWVEGNEYLMMPAAAARFGPASEWPMFGVRQWYGQPVRFCADYADGTLWATGGVVCVAIGQ